MSEILLGTIGGDSPDKPLSNDIHHRVPSSESGIEDGLFPSNEGTNGIDLVNNRIITPDVNVYQQKKTLAQGMMDLALISANANQLRSVIESQEATSYFVLCVFLIGLSLFLQIGVGVMLIWNSRYNVKNHHEMCRANRLNNFTVCSIFLVTITNVFISVFAGQK